MMRSIFVRRHRAQPRAADRATEPDPQSRALSLAFMLLGLAVLLGFASWLRWQRVVESGLSVDEFATLWASQRTLELGAPFMPSGVLYTRGILSTYVIAALASLGELTYTVGRMPSLVFGLASICAVFYIGHRNWNTRVGWLAAAGLAILPEAVVWSGRARFYSQLMFFVLLTVWSAYEAIHSDKDAKSGAVASWRAHLFFALCFVLALFTQEETILLYPPILLGILLWKGWRYFRQAPVLAAQLICVVAMILRYAMEKIGQPGYFEAISSHKPYIEFLYDLSAAWGVYGELLVTSRRLAWTLFGLLAIVLASKSLRQVRWRLLALSRFHQATLFFAIQFLFVLLVLHTVVGGGWRDVRYVLMVQPFWLLVGAAGVVWIVDRLAAHAAVRWSAMGVLTLLLVWPMWPLTLQTLEKRGEDYQFALNYVAAHRRPGDVVMSPQPPACAFVLGEPCDFYARQRGYEPYVVSQDGTLVDRWSGAQLLDTTEQLEATIRAAPRVWLVVDGERLGRRYNDDFVRVVVEQFETEFEEQGAMAMVAQGWRETPQYAVQESFVPPVPMGVIELVGWERTPATPGEHLQAMLTWRQAEPFDAQISTSLQLVASDGARITQDDGPPARGMISTADFSRSLLPDLKTLALPEGLSPGRYRLEAIAYDAPTRTPLSSPAPLGWFRIGPPPSPPDREIGARWQNHIALVGSDALPALAAGERLPVRLVWMANEAIDADYTVFLHLIGPDGAIIAQSDHIPEGGFYPTSAWTVNDPVEDIHGLQLPTVLPAGEYRLVAGWYQPESGKRALVENASDALELERWLVE